MKRSTFSIVGGESLIGRELQELLAESDLHPEVKLIGLEEDAATLTERGGEAAVILPFEEESLRGSELAFLAGVGGLAARAVVLAKSGSGPVLIDVAYAAEEDPAARLRAPMVEPPGFQTPGAPLHVIAHPAAIGLALLLSRLAAHARIRNSIAHVFEPASERGSRGLDELQQQTVNLLSFKPLPKAVFDEQLGFNLLARYGNDAPQSLERIELRIERHLAALLTPLGAIPMPSLRLIQAPVFHGYSLSVHVEFEERPGPAALAKALSSADVDVRGGDLEPPSNIGFAGQAGISVGAISADRNNPRALWFWVVADNLHLMAENAVAVARAIVAPKDPG